MVLPCSSLLASVISPPVSWTTWSSLKGFSQFLTTLESVLTQIGPVDHQGGPRAHTTL